jgi:hypothetical protein
MTDRSDTNRFNAGRAVGGGCLVGVGIPRRAASRMLPGARLYVTQLLRTTGTAEMTHKIKVRTTRLVRGAPSVRTKNAALLSETYAIRSKLVYTGKVDENRQKSIAGRKLTRADIVKETVEIAVELVKVLIRRGGIPGWTEFDVTEQST